MAPLREMSGFCSTDPVIIFTILIMHSNNKTDFVYYIIIIEFQIVITWKKDITKTMLLKIKIKALGLNVLLCKTSIKSKFLRNFHIMKHGFL